MNLNYIYIYIYIIYTLTKIINATLLFLLLFFMSSTQRSKTFSSQKAYFSQILLTNLSKSVSEHFSFAGIIHPPHRCGISKCWLDGMIIAQVCLRLATTKGHSRMCSPRVIYAPASEAMLIFFFLNSKQFTYDQTLFFFLRGWQNSALNSMWTCRKMQNTLLLNVNRPQVSRN